jgi:hypothetical protein
MQQQVARPEWKYPLLDQSPELSSRTDLSVSEYSAGRILKGSSPRSFCGPADSSMEGENISVRRIFLKSLSSLPLSVVLANPRISRAVSAGLQDVEAKLADGRITKGALAEPQGQATGGILLIHEWWGFL